MKKIILLTTIIFAAACTPKDKPRRVHESAREWKASETPNNDQVRAQEFETFDLAASHVAATDPSVDLMKTILQPLSRIVLNKRFVGDPLYHTTKLYEMIDVFNGAFLKLLERGDKSDEFKTIRDLYFQTLFAGCSRDLRLDCVNDRLFSANRYHTRIMTRLAQELDTELDALIETKGTPGKCVAESSRCRALLEERYRRLAMGMRKATRTRDDQFPFAYMKHARAFALLLDYDKVHASEEGVEDMSTSYLASIHSKVFETLIGDFKPANGCTPEFKSFIDNFNPWGYSQKRADIFQYGTKIMFGFGAQCSLYKDGGKTRIADAVREAITQSQSETDTYGRTFHQMVLDIQAKFGNNLFRNLGMLDQLAQLEKLDSPFYNEYFLVVDRLFRGHLNSGEVLMVLSNTKEDRTAIELPKTVLTYLKVYLLHMVVETNSHMAEIYKSNTIASDKVFEEATTSSRELTARWHTIQSQFDLLQRVMGSYSKGQNLNSAEFRQADDIIKSVNHNIHLTSVWPNMIVMTYFLSKMKGTIVVNTWWGRIDVNADTILDSFFDGGIESPWFRFGKDPEKLDRSRILFAWEYMLATEALSSFSTKDGATGADGRTKFFELIFSKYVDDNIHEMRTRINNFRASFFGSTSLSVTNAACDYELGVTNRPPALQMNFLDLIRYTYSGLGSNGANLLLNKFFIEPKDNFADLRGEIDSRMTFMRVLIDLVEQDLINNDQIKKSGDPHVDTAKFYELNAQLHDMRVELIKTFTENHKRYFDCALKLQEVERRRMNRLYEEEKAHLGRVFDLMKPLVAMDDAARDAAVAEINRSYFRNAANGYRFDAIDGLTYRMSKYDLLQRMAKRVQSDIFVNLTDEEKAIYAGSDPSLIKPRRVSVIMTDGVEREELVSKQTTNTLFVNGATDADREAFIKQGMAALNGKINSFVEWDGQRANDVGLFDYLNSLVEAYLTGPVRASDGKTYRVAANELIDAYTRVTAASTMDDFDIRNARMFGNDGRRDRDFYKTGFRLIESNGTRLALYYPLMLATYGRAYIKLQEEMTPALAKQGGQAASQALETSKALSSERNFIFPPSGKVIESVRTWYGTRAHRMIGLVKDVYDAIAAKQAEVGDVANLDPRLKQPLYLQNGQPVVWYHPGVPFIDEQKRNDLNILIEDFHRRTNDFYGTKRRFGLK